MTTVDVPLYTSAGEFLGYHEEDSLRALISRKEARVVRKGDDRRVVLNAEATHRIRSLSSSAHGSALKTTYTEDLYWGEKKKGPVVVTGHVFAMKKYRPGEGFVPYRELEGFRRGRYNPDEPKPALYPTLRVAKEAMENAG